MSVANDDFTNLVGYRDVLIDGSKPTPNGWLWPTTDIGLFDGPDKDWRAFKPLYLSLPRAFKVVVQAGGGCGMYPFLLSRHFERVYAFEPNPLNFHCMVANCPKPSIFKINAALGNGNGFVASGRFSEDNRGTHTVFESGEGVIPQFKIDQLGLDSCDMIALDLEGYEKHALAGAVETIRRFKPVVTVENNNHEVTMIMTDLGYRISQQVAMDTFWIPDNPQSA